MGAIPDPLTVGVEQQLSVGIGDGGHAFVSAQGAIAQRCGRGGAHVQAGAEAEVPVAVLQLSLCEQRVVQRTGRQCPLYPRSSSLAHVGNDAQGHQSDARHRLFADQW